MANTTKKYRVLNPRGIPKGIRIVAFNDGKKDGALETVEAFEGDELVPPIPLADAEDLVAKGFLEDVTNG